MHPAYAAADTDPNSMSAAQSTFCGAICTREERADDEKSAVGGAGGGVVVVCVCAWGGERV